MKLTRSTLWGGLALVALTAGSGAARAQDGTTAAPGSIAPPAITVTSLTTLTAPRPLPAARFNQTATGQVALRLSRAAGVSVLADSSVSTMPVTVNTTGGTVETVLPQIVATLPKGAMIRAVLVPDGPAALDGDAVSRYLIAQDTFSTAGVKPALANKTAPAAAFVPNTWEVLGQKLPLDKALSLASGLNLRPVYLVTIPRTGLDTVGKMSMMQAESMRMWAGMTPDQRKTLMEGQFNNLMNMDAGDRQAMLGQMMQQGVMFMQKMQSLTPEQQKTLQQEFAGAARNAGLPMPPGAGGPKGQ